MEGVGSVSSINIIAKRTTNVFKNSVMWGKIRCLVSMGGAKIVSNTIMSKTTNVFKILANKRHRYCWSMANAKNVSIPIQIKISVWLRRVRQTRS